MEVVVVLLLVGMLSSIAVPRFLNLKQEALIATFKGIEGSLRSATTIYQSLAAIRGVDSGRISINGADVLFNSGFPDGHWNNAIRYILDVSTDTGYTNANTDCTDFSLCGVGMRRTIPGVVGTQGGRGVIIWPEGFRINDLCFAYYYNRRDGSYPMIGTVDAGC